MPTERISFDGHAGKLDARLDLPDGPHLATAVFAHCFTCGKDIAAARRIAARLNTLGLAVLRFDFTGLGHSGSEFANTSLTSNVEDLAHAVAYLNARDMAPELLIGHSLGGAAVLRACADLPQIKAVATLAAPFDPAHVTQNFADALPQIAAEGSAEVSLGGRPFRIGQAFVDDVQGQALAPAIANLNAALLVLHSPTDQIVGIDNASRIFMAAKHPKSFVTLDDADHLISRAEHAEYAADVIATWARKYLSLKQPAPPVGAPEGVVRSAEADPDGFLQDITHGTRHHLLADEPRAYGGTNQGLSPYGLLSAGLAACTSMTIRMYARRKGWPLDHVMVDVSHDKVHAQDADTTTPVKVDTWKRRITLRGDLDDAQRTRLLEIADKCPVHRTLETSASVLTELAPPA